MESCRLKNIAIVILLLLNGFLLLLLGWEYLQNVGGEAETGRQLDALYSANQLELSLQVDRLPQPLNPLTLLRSTAAEKALAAALLGESSEPVSMGGGIYDYSTQAGLLHFRSGGGFDGTGLQRPVENIEKFVKELCSSFGYGRIRGTLEKGTGEVTAVGFAADVPVEGCGIRLQFEDGVLTAVSGTHISLEEASVREEELLSGVTALVRFLDYRNAAGVVCAEVRSADCVYELQSNPLSLSPVWRIGTDSHDYLVNCVTGEVARRQSDETW